jgi:hypothetical protein
LLLAAVAAACGGDGGGGGVSPTATSTVALASTGSDEPLPRDLIDLAQRMLGIADPPRQVALPRPALGDVQEFSVLELPASGDDRPARKSISAELRAVTEHGYLFVDEASDAPQAEIDDAARVFDEEIWPEVTAAFGMPADPGVDRDPRIVILHAGIGPAAAGYVSDDDRYVTAVAPLSNQREMVYLNLNLRPFGGEQYRYVLAHELQHLIHQASDPGEDTWLNEGLSEASARLVGGGTGFQNSFLERPDTALTAWSDLEASAPHYGAASLFVAYLLEQSGGDALDLIEEQADGIEGVEAFLRATGEERSFGEFAGDWAVANLLDQPAGPYGYARLEPEAAATQSVEAAGLVEGEVGQYAADYLDLLAEDFPAGAQLTFTGAPETAAVAAQAGAKGAFWWSGSGDGIDSVLTREVDLMGLERATLTFRLWHDIERWFDWGQVGVSTDGGETWTAVAGDQTTTDDPLQAGYGPGYNGRSGGGSTPRWVDERIDLSAYGGSTILVRFELVTNDSASQPGIAIDDIAVPEAGFFDGAETDAGGWERHGWLRVTGPLAQRFELRVVTFGAETNVQQVTLDARNEAAIDLSGLGTDYPRVVVVVVAVTEGTAEAASYRYEVR